MEQKLDKLKIVDRDVIKYIVIVFMGLGHFLAWLCGTGNPNASYFLPVPYQILIDLLLSHRQPCSSLYQRDSGTQDQGRVMQSDCSFSPV